MRKTPQSRKKPPSAVNASAVTRASWISGETFFRKTSIMSPRGPVTRSRRASISTGAACFSFNQPSPLSEISSGTRLRRSTRRSSIYGAVSKLEATSIVSTRRMRRAVAIAGNQAEDRKPVASHKRKAISKLPLIKEQRGKRPSEFKGTRKSNPSTDILSLPGRKNSVCEENRRRITGIFVGKEDCLDVSLQEKAVLNISIPKKGKKSVPEVDSNFESAPKRIKSDAVNMLSGKRKNIGSLPDAATNDRSPAKKPRGIFSRVYCKSGLVPPEHATLQRNRVRGTKNSNFTYQSPVQMSWETCSKDSPSSSFYLMPNSSKTEKTFESEARPKTRRNRPIIMIQSPFVAFSNIAYNNKYHEAAESNVVSINDMKAINTAVSTTAKKYAKCNEKKSPSINAETDLDKKRHASLKKKLPNSVSPSPAKKVPTLRTCLNKKSSEIGKSNISIAAVTRNRTPTREKKHTTSYSVLRTQKSQVSPKTTRLSEKRYSGTKKTSCATKRTPDSQEKIADGTMFSRITVHQGSRNRPHLHENGDESTNSPSGAVNTPGGVQRMSLNAKNQAAFKNSTGVKKTSLNSEIHSLNMTLSSTKTTPVSKKKQSSKKKITATKRKLLSEKKYPVRKTCSSTKKTTSASKRLPLGERKHSTSMTSTSIEKVAESRRKLRSEKKHPNGSPSVDLNVKKIDFRFAESPGSKYGTPVLPRQKSKFFTPQAEPTPSRILIQNLKRRLDSDIRREKKEMQKQLSQQELMNVEGTAAAQLSMDDLKNISDSSLNETEISRYSCCRKKGLKQHTLHTARKNFSQDMTDESVQTPKSRKQSVSFRDKHALERKAESTVVEQSAVVKQEPVKRKRLKSSTPISDESGSCIYHDDSSFLNVGESGILLEHSDFNAVRDPVTETVPEVEPQAVAGGGIFSRCLIM